MKTKPIQFARLFSPLIILTLAFSSLGTTLVLADAIFTPVTPALPGGWQQSGFLYGVWGSGTNDVYAVAVGYNADGSGRPLLYHYDGSSWTSITPALPNKWQNGFLYGTWGSGANNVYGVGFGADGGGNSLPLIYHYDGSNWTSITPVMPSGWQPDGRLYGAWGSGANDLYVVGHGYDGSWHPSPLIYHYDGSSWISITPAMPGGWQPQGYLRGAWGSGANDVYAVGYGVDGGGNSLPLIYHYDGSNWTSITPAMPGGWQQNGRLDGAWGSGANNVYAVGYGMDGGGNSLPLIYHYDGSSWTSVTPAMPNGWQQDGRLYGAWGSGANDIYAVGSGVSNGSSLPLIYHYTGSSWTSVTPAMPSGWRQNGSLYSTWGSGPNNLYVVGFGVDGPGSYLPLTYQTGISRHTAADFNGDGKTDIGMHRPSVGDWFVKDQFSANWGISGDIPAPGDYDGNSTTDIAIFRPSSGQWYVKNQFVATWGLSGDVPVPGDYNGDGKTDVAIYRPSTGQWFIKDQSAADWGLSGDIPVPGDYDGDGDTDIAIYRPSTGQWFIKDQFAATWGLSDDIPIPGDFNGDGSTDIAIYRPSTGQWFVKDQFAANWGINGDLPIPGDYDGDSDTDIAVYRPSTGQWFVKDQFAASWGISGDYPLPAPDTNGDGDPYQ